MQQLFPLLIFLNQPNRFRATNSPVLRNTFCVYIYSFWYGAPTLLSTGATVEMELSTVAPIGNNVGALYQTLYIHLKIAPEDGRICRPKSVGLI